MFTQAEHMKIADSISRALDPPFPPQRGWLQWAKRLWQARSIRKTLRGLDGLDQRLMKDVGLFREILPNGELRYRRH